MIGKSIDDTDIKIKLGILPLWYYPRCIMIASITGKLTLRNEKFVVVEVLGVGYKIFVSVTDEKKIAAASGLITFWTHLHVRETELELYGFMDKEELEFFETLIRISGIGPKSALGILSVAPAETLKRAIAKEDYSYLTKVSGIGRKTAEKIVLELKEKLRDENLSAEGYSLKDEGDVLEALRTLGYPIREAREALKQISEEVKGESARIKAAIKILGK